MHAGVAGAVAAEVLIGLNSEKANTFTLAGTPGPGAVTMLWRPTKIHEAGGKAYALLVARIGAERSEESRRGARR